MRFTLKKKYDKSYVRNEYKGGSENYCNQVRINPSSDGQGRWLEGSYGMYMYSPDRGKYFDVIFSSQYPLVIQKICRWR